MTDGYRTDQEAFWAGSFGTDYVERNKGQTLLSSKLNMLSTALKAADRIRSVIEFGPNVGYNLRALQLLLPEAEMAGIEINPDAAVALRSLEGVTVHEGSILDSHVTRTYDLVLISGVLIHINPDALAQVYDNLHAASARYILVAEYYNPSPVAISYRGHADRLFKRDFAGEMLDRFADLKLVDYGFCYHRDPNFPVDDVTWFLLEKRD